ncbi:MAG: YjjG family noncanonical pyrimidine nucleotidase [Ruminococcus sp.]|uniref:YjjG family noncanonical pyrimidine nucleotidase n=1 Tax=Ruminococcus sp. TaxID=41978 RepID=UPI0028733302|nr:YjjG family noncanonical pyrimidine nucleotidase [Ruminococcus sp.]MBQ3284380.1 YjjG family noncanonical pyrimidine nucleotidase [Ruminococcus sp.]
MRKNYDIVLLDADETVYDFKRAEKTAVSLTLHQFGVDPTDEVTALYSDINLSCWKMLERGELDREELKSYRFQKLFERIGAQPVDYTAVNATYESNLSHQAFLLDGALDFVKKLHQYCKIYMATNGLTIPQTGRFNRAAFKPYVDGIYISEQIGVSKPDKAYFDYIFCDLNITDKSRVIMVGDSLTSDMLGGRNAGLTTCRYLNGAEPSHSDLCDYEIQTYDEFFDILFDCHGEVEKGSLS